MTAFEPHIHAKSNPALQQSSLKTEKCLLDARYIFHAWLVAFLLLLLALIFNPYLHEVKYLVTIFILFSYFWFMLLAKLDQLAASLGIKSSVVYKTLLIPVIGTMVCYRNIMQLANEKQLDGHEV